MSSLIEQAARRLQQLKQAGAVVPEPAPQRQSVSTVQSAVESLGSQTQRPRPVQPVVTKELAVSRQIRLDREALAKASIVMPNGPRSALADQYRVIKRPLIANALGKGKTAVHHGNLIMVTSALPGEGKTFTAVNLAMSIAAELDSTVLLVDADVARPSLPRVLGVPATPGLLDIVKDSVDMADVLLRTDIEKLSVLPSGTPHPRATELLASDAMGRLLDEMARRYPDRIIVFDSPPLLITTEARVLAARMGQVVMVVQAGRTSQSDVEHALSAIEACPVRLMVLNKATAEGAAPYGYGYGYGYGERGD